MIKFIISLVIAAFYVGSALFFRRQLRYWHEDKIYVDLGLEDVIMMFLPVLNLIAGIYLMLDKQDKQIIRNFFGLK